MNTLKQARTNSKSRLTREVNKIKQHVAYCGSRTQLNVLRNFLSQCQADCEEANAAYVAAPGLSEKIQLYAGTWMNSLATTTSECFDLINNYLIERGDEASSAASLYSRSSVNSQGSRRNQEHKWSEMLEKAINTIKRVTVAYHQHHARDPPRPPTPLPCPPTAPTNPPQLYPPACFSPTTPSDPLPYPPLYNTANISPANAQATHSYAVPIPSVNATASIPPFQDQETSKCQNNVVARLPKVKITPFDGNPINWQMFIANYMSLVHNSLSDDAVRLAMLREYLSPDVRESISETLYDPSLYAKALQELERVYGQPFLVSQAHLDTIASLPVLRDHDHTAYGRFSSKLHGAVAALNNERFRHELQSSYLLKQVIAKLPSSMRGPWGRHVMKLQPTSPTVSHLDAWLQSSLMSSRFEMKSSDEFNNSNPKSKIAKDSKASRTSHHQPSIMATFVESKSQKVTKLVKSDPCFACKRQLSLHLKLSHLRRRICK